MHRALLVGVGLAALLAAGCHQHYRVSDPQTGRTYFTHDITRHVGGGVSFEDGRTGDKVTLQNSRIDRISEDVYDTGVRYTTPQAIIVP